MFIKKLFTVFLIYTFLLTGCAGGYKGSGSNPQVGPPPSSNLKKDIPQSTPSVQTNVQVVRPSLDVVVPVFDPGLPEDPDDYADDGIWPELRRAEANRFAWKLKNALDDTKAFGAVRVTPDATATGDIYVLGRIEESNGAEVEIDAQVIDISGAKWFDESYEHEVSEAFHKDIRNDGKDPYDPIFKEIAEDIVKELQDYSVKELADLQYLANLRFGANFSEESFGPFMQQRYGKTRLVSKPNDDDPMYQRVKGLRVRDQLFIDSLQTNYEGFNDQMDESYMMWQEQSLIEVKAQQAASRETMGNAIGGALLLGLAVLSGVAAADSNSTGGTAAGTTGAILGGIAATKMIQKSFKTSEEAKMHKEALDELGQSLDMELSPQVVAFEEESVKLTGDAREQFDQWRQFLQKIYNQERTPDVQL